MSSYWFWSHLVELLVKAAVMWVLCRISNSITWIEHWTLFYTPRIGEALHKSHSWWSSSKPRSNHDLDIIPSILISQFHNTARILQLLWDYFWFLRAHGLALPLVDFSNRFLPTNQQTTWSQTHSIFGVVHPDVDEIPISRTSQRFHQKSSWPPSSQSMLMAWKGVRSWLMKARGLCLKC